MSRGRQIAGDALVLDGAGVTDFNVEVGEDPQFQAYVSNTTNTDYTAVVDWYLGGTYIGSRDQVVEAGASLGGDFVSNRETLAINRTWQDLRDLGVSFGDNQLVAALRSGSAWDGQEADGGTVTLVSLAGNVTIECPGYFLSLKKGETVRLEATITNNNPVYVSVGVEWTYAGTRVASQPVGETIIPADGQATAQEQVSYSDLKQAAGSTGQHPVRVNKTTVQQWDIHT